MPVLAGDDLDAAAQSLEHRHADLHHACQLLELASYCEIGGVPSRGLMEDRALPFTPFRSDADDRQRGIWYNVFGNVQDFTGSWVAQVNRNSYVGQCTEEMPQSASVPNPYGPILFVIRPDALRACTDASFQLRSAFVQGFDRANEGLSRDELESCFEQYNWNGEVRHRVKYRASLQQTPTLARLVNRITSGLEFCLTLNGDYVPFHLVRHVVVDDVIVGERSLQTAVEELLTPIGIKVFARRYWEGPARAVYASLVNLIAQVEIPSPFALQKYLAELPNADASAIRYLAQLCNYLQTPAGERFGYTAENWTSYLRMGTIDVLRA